MDVEFLSGPEYVGTVLGWAPLGRLTDVGERERGGVAGESLKVR